MTREEYIKKNKDKLAKQGFIYDPKSGNFTYVEPSDYIKSGTKTTKKPTSKKK